MSIRFSAKDASGAAGGLTSTAGGVGLELGRVVDGGELASGADVADLDADHFDCRVVGLGGVEGRGAVLRRLESRME